MKKIIYLFLLAAFLLPETTCAAETRCGWFENPTPSNAWLIDKDGQWIISTQGGYHIDDEWPDFENEPWVKTNGPDDYGYGCACMVVETDHKEMHITKIISSQVKPLSACRKDKNLPKHID